MLVAKMFVLSVINSSASSLLAGNHSSRRAKRIAFGELLPSLDTYKMYYFVQLRYSWACITDQTKHEESLNLCQEDHHICGGTLIHPEFVLTAAHCVMYFEVIVYEKGKQIDDWVHDTGDLIYYRLVEAWERLVHAVIGFFVEPKPRHTLYSDWALLMGSHDWFKMKQKRHVMKVFPHRVFPKNIRTKELDEYFDRTSNSWHDVALLRACQPFITKAGELEIAPMLGTEENLRRQYERIVSSGKVCLYVGYGRQHNRTEALSTGYPLYDRNLMLHTWRQSNCYAECNGDVLGNRTAYEHTCNLCSRHHGKMLGTAQRGDSGSPVTCDGKFVSTMTKATLIASRNYTRTDSYPVHCIINSISTDRLNYYKTVAPGDEPFHPLNATRLRRFLLPPE